MNKPIVFEKDYMVESVDIGLNQRLKLTTLLGFLEDVASEHASVLGFGYEEMVKAGLLWVLFRQRVKMSRWPQWHEQITIKTWSRPVRGIYATREYEIFCQDERLGACSTTWMVLDSHTRRPHKLNQIAQHFPAQQDYQLDFSADKLSLSSLPHHLQTHTFVASDLDINEHVNNATYARCVLDTLDVAIHRQYRVSDYAVNFIHESFVGEHMQLFSNRLVDHNDDDIASSSICYCGKKADDTCIFISQLQLGALT